MGYITDHIASYWGLLDSYISTITTSLIRMGRADNNNGQIAANRQNNNKYIDKWTYPNKTGPGNGEHLINTCRKHDFVCGNTSQIPQKVTNLN